MASRNWSHENKFNLPMMNLTMSSNDRDDTIFIHSQKKLDRSTSGKVYLKHVVQAGSMRRLHASLTMVQVAVSHSSIFCINFKMGDIFLIKYQFWICAIIVKKYDIADPMVPVSSSYMEFFSLIIPGKSSETSPSQWRLACWDAYFIFYQRHRTENTVITMYYKWTLSVVSDIQKWGTANTVQYVCPI